MALTLPKGKTDDQTDAEYASYLQDFDPAQDFLDKYTESTDPTETDFSATAYEGDEGRGGFFSPDGQGRPDTEVAAYYGGEKQRQKDILNRDIDAFNKRYGVGDTSTPIDDRDPFDGYKGHGGRGDRGDASSGRTLIARDRPAVRPTGQGDVGSSREDFTSTGKSFLGGYSRSQRTGSGASSSFSQPSSANPNQTGPLRWWNKGRNVNVPNESTASWGDLWRDNQRQAGQSNQNYQKGQKPGFFGRPDRSVLGVDIPESIRNRRFVTVPPEQGGPGSGPTPLVRQVAERVLAPVATGASIFAEGQTGSNLYQGVESAADYVPGLRPEPETDIGKRTGDFLAEKAGDVKDWFVDKMGNVKKDLQTRQLRRAGLGTDVQGNVVTENQRTKAADEFIAGVENWEPLADQRTFEEIPEARGGIVGGQWDEDYLVSPASVTETTNPGSGRSIVTPSTVNLQEKAPSGSRIFDSYLWEDDPSSKRGQGIEAESALYDQSLNLYSDLERRYASLDALYGKTSKLHTSLSSEYDRQSGRGDDADWSSYNAMYSEYTPLSQQYDTDYADYTRLNEEYEAMTPLAYGTPEFDAKYGPEGKEGAGKWLYDNPEGIWFKSGDNTWINYETGTKKNQMDFPALGGEAAPTKVTA